MVKQMTYPQIDWIILAGKPAMFGLLGLVGGMAAFRRPTVAITMGIFAALASFGM